MFGKSIKKKKEEFDRLIQIYNESPTAKGVSLDYRHHLVENKAFGYNRPVIVFRKQCSDLKPGDPYGDYYHVVEVIQNPLNKVDLLIVLERS